MFWTLLIAIATGMRTMTGIAVICWAAYLGYLPVQGTWAFWTAKLAAVIVFSAAALGEYIGDTLPSTPSRKSFVGLSARLAFALLAGMILATVLQQPKAGGVVLGLIGVLIGTYGGYALRMWGARLAGRDLPIALLESAVAVGLCLVAIHHIHREIMVTLEHAAMLLR